MVCNDRHERFIFNTGCCGAATVRSSERLEKSFRFYEELGFTATRLGDGLASMQLGPFSFLLQNYYAEGFAGNFMMQMLVKDVQEWWRRIDGLDLAAHYGVRAPQAPAVQPWGLTVAYVVDPAGVLWHIAQQRG